MADNVISLQELIDAQKDAYALELIMNEAPWVEVNTRLGRKCYSIHTIQALIDDLEVNSTLALSELQDAINIAAAAGAGANGWTDLLIQTEDGSTQRDFNRKTITTVETVADLLAIENPRDGQTVETLSYQGAQTALAMPYKGGGVYTYNSTYSEVNDGGLVLNGWVRQFSGGHVSIEWFGAKGRDYTTDSEALVKAVASGYSIQLENNFYYVDTPVTLTNRGQEIRGCGAMSGFLLGSGSGDFFTFTKEQNGTVLSGGGMSNFRIEAASRTGGAVIRVFKANHQVFEDLIVSNPFNGLVAEKFNNLTLSRCSFLGVRGLRGVLIDGRNYRSDLFKFNFLNISGSTSLHVGGKASANSPVGIHVLGDVHTVQGNVSVVIGVIKAYKSEGYTSTVSAGDHTIGQYTRPAFQRIRNIECDFAHARTIELIDAADTTFSDSYIHGCQTGVGVYVESNCINTSFVNCRVTSHAQQGYLIAGKNTKIIGGDVCFNGHSESNVYSAIDIKSTAEKVLCSGVHTGHYYSSSTLYQRYGLIVQSGAKNVIFTGGELTGLTADWVDVSGIDARNNVIVKDYLGSSKESDQTMLVTALTSADEGGTAVLKNTIERYVFNNFVELSAYNFTLPSDNLLDGQETSFVFQNNVGILNLTNGTVEGGSLAVNGRVEKTLVYVKSSARWYVK